ncbi:MAG: hypothetical protein AB8U82_03950 [Rickettsia endosymbiont of Haemaphysalis japonica]
MLFFKYISDVWTVHAKKYEKNIKTNL